MPVTQKTKAEVQLHKAETWSEFLAHQQRSTLIGIDIDETLIHHIPTPHIKKTKKMSSLKAQKKDSSPIGKQSAAPLPQSIPKQERFARASDSWFAFMLKSGSELTALVNEFNMLQKKAPVRSAEPDEHYKSSDPNNKFQPLLDQKCTIFGITSRGSGDIATTTSLQTTLCGFPFQALQAQVFKKEQTTTKPTSYKLNQISFTLNTGSKTKKIIYQNGILYCNGADKGLVLNHFFNNIPIGIALKNSSSFFSLIDDSADKCQSVLKNAVNFGFSSVNIFEYTWKNRYAPYSHETRTKREKDLDEQFLKKHSIKTKSQAENQIGMFSKNARTKHKIPPFPKDGHINKDACSI